MIPLHDAIEPEQLDEWFAQRVRSSARLSRAGQIALVPLAAGVAFLTWWIIWFIVLIGPAHLLNMSWFQIEATTWWVLTVIFVWQFTTGRILDETYRFSNQSSSELEVTLGRPGNEWTIVMDSGIAHAAVRVLTLFLLTSPRMLVKSVELHRRCRRLKALDLHSGAIIVNYLAESQVRVPIQFIADRFPEIELKTTIPALGDIDGIVFLRKDELSITLAPRFFEEFSQWRVSQAPESADN